MASAQTQFLAKIGVETMLKKFFFFLAFVYGFSGLVLAKQTTLISNLCSGESALIASDFEFQPAFSKAIWNQNDDLLISLDSDADGIADELYRFNFGSQKKPNSIADNWKNSEIEIELNKWSFLDRTVLKIKSTENLFRSFAIAHSAIDCVSELASKINLDVADIYLSDAIAHHTFSGVEKSSHEGVFDEFLNIQLINYSESSCGSNSKNPLWCASGGPGALSCSFHGGGFGGINAGNCSIECFPGYYACCGPGLGRYCSCVYVGGVGGGGPSGGTGSGGDTGIGGAPGGGGDDDDDDDDQGDQDDKSCN